MVKDKLLESNIVFNGKIFDIKTDMVKLENGNLARRDILVHNGACAGLPITEDGKIILVRQYRHAIGEFLYEIPAGGLEKDEDPVDCIIRELQEEIGYRPNSAEKLFTLALAPGYSGERLHCYLCKDLVKSSLPCDDDENLDVFSFTIDEILQMIKENQICDAKTIACISYVIASDIL